jgi:ADP-heptose:LPS heptosyltransferase
LFITSSYIGDTVLYSGVLAQLIENYPDDLVTIATGSAVVTLFSDLPNLEQIYSLVEHRRIDRWWNLWCKTRSRHWRVVVDLRGSLFSWTLKAEQRLIFIQSKRRREHIIEELMRRFKLKKIPFPCLWINPVRQIWTEEYFSDDLPIIAIGPTANWRAKQWPTERFFEVIHKLTEIDRSLLGSRVVVLVAEKERSMMLSALKTIPIEQHIDCIIISGAHLLDVAAMLRRCVLYIGNDSGLMHLAAATGIPTLGLFGPSPEWRYHPFGANTAIVRTSESYEDLTNAHNYDYSSQDSLMNSISVDLVVRAATMLLSKK